MSFIAGLIRELDGSLWNEINPDRCPCHGSGWLVSDFDTIHRCQTHGQGVPSPEDDAEGFDGEAHRLELYRRAYRTFRGLFRKLDAEVRYLSPNGYTAKEFDMMARILIPASNPTPSQWVAAAEQCWEKLSQEVADLLARRQGFSCALEARWNDDAIRERQDRIYA